MDVMSTLGLVETFCRRVKRIFLFGESDIFFIAEPLTKYGSSGGGYAIMGFDSLVYKRHGEGLLARLYSRNLNEPVFFFNSHLFE